MTRRSFVLTLTVVSACMAGAIDDGTPSGNGSSGGGSSGEGSSGEGSSDGGPRMPLAATVADVGVVPGDMAIITVTLNREPTQNLLFTYTTADGTALAGANYTSVTSGSAMIAQGQLSTDIAIPTSSTPGVLYLGKRFVVTLSFAAEPTLNHVVTISFSAAPPLTGTHVLKNKWAAFPASSSTPAARAGHSAIWTGKKLIIWGGFSGTVSPYLYYGGAAYDPGTNSWTPISSAGAPSARSSHVAVWTGAKMIVWGGYNESQLWRNDGGSYDPATDTWSALPQNSSIPSQRAAAAGAWDGAKMIVWGGYSGSLGYLNDGAIYDPGNGAWVAIAATNAPSARSGATGVWTGDKMIVWSGAYAAHPTVDGIFNYYNDGAAYNPVANTWTQISSAGAPAARTLSGTAWTGMQMITWAGGDSSVLYGDGGFYNPGANVWNSMSVLHAPANRDFGASVWTGSSFIYWGGYAGRSSATAYLNDGGIYY